GRGETVPFQRVTGHEDSIGNLPAKLEGPTRMVDPALMEVGCCRNREGGLEVGWTTGSQEVLRGAEVGLPHGADIAVGPGQAGSPLHSIVAIWHLPDKRIIFIPVRAKAPTRVLHDHPVATLDKV